ncbi:MAG: amidase family protein [Xanthobacteraceae bacterium]|nr:amidase family protein [Xanthobacteraceae bacterium]
MITELWRLDASEQARLIRKGAISSVELTKETLARVDAVNPKINAIVDLMAGEALAAAEEADKKTRAGSPLGLLHGVPVTVKINVDFAGRANTNGVVAYKDNICKEDNPVVSNLKKSGAIIIGRTNTPAFSMRWFTDNALHGRTLNPWDKGVTPGGSSGGAAASLITGMGAIGHGNDIGGSIRYPAYACGLQGIRPSFGRVPTFNPSLPAERPHVAQYASMQGPLARSIRDLRISLDAMAARDTRDPLWIPLPPVNVPNGRPTKVALFDEWSGCKADPQVADALKKSAQWLEDAGYIVERAAPPFFEDANQLWLRLVLNEGRFGMNQAIAQFGDDAIKKSYSSKEGIIPELDLETFVKELALRSKYLRAWNEFFEKYPVLLLPSSWKQPFPIDADLNGGNAFVDLADAQSPQLATPILGLPGVAVSTGLADGVPMGVQLVTARFEETKALDAAEVIEACAPPVEVIDPKF